MLIIQIKKERGVDMGIVLNMLSAKWLVIEDVNFPGICRQVDWYIHRVLRDSMLFSSAGVLQEISFWTAVNIGVKKPLRNVGTFVSTYTPSNRQPFHQKYLYLCTLTL